MQLIEKPAKCRRKQHFLFCMLFTKNNGACAKQSIYDSDNQICTTTTTTTLYGILRKPTLADHYSSPPTAMHAHIAAIGARSFIVVVVQHVMLWLGKPETSAQPRSCPRLLNNRHPDSVRFETCGNMWSKCCIYIFLRQTHLCICIKLVYIYMCVYKVSQVS